MRTAYKPPSKTSELHQIRLREFRREHDISHGAVAEQVGQPFFVPTLVHLCAQCVADHFAQLPEIDALRESDSELYSLVLERLPPRLPLSVTVPRIVSTDPYWKSACEARWSAGQLATRSNGVLEAPERGGWKRVCLEQTIEDCLLSLPTGGLVGDSSRVLSGLCALCRDFIFELCLPHQRAHLDLYEQLVARLPYLKTLELTYDAVTVGPAFSVQEHTGFTEADALSVKEVLRRSSEVTTLKLSKNQIDTHLFRAIAAGAASNTTLTVLGLSHNVLDDEGASVLALLLSCKTLPLRQLDLSDNNIGERGAVALSDALRKNTQLEFLNLHLNRVGNVGGAALFVSLETNSTLENMIVSCNVLGPEVTRALAVSLPRNRSLRRLDLSGNSGIGSDGEGSLLLSTVSACDRLELVDVRATSISSEEAAEVERVSFARREERKQGAQHFKESEMHAEIARYVELRVMKTQGV